MNARAATPESWTTWRFREHFAFNAVSAELHYIDTPARVDEIVERVGSVRQAVGRDFGVAVDFHGRVHRPMAKVLAKFKSR
jgi:L-alanine-DL-glutamate epimerase-like enolase superfamily enzyme